MRHRLIMLSLLVAVSTLLALPERHALALDPLSISAVTPNTGVSSGGTPLTIYGSGFQTGAYVVVGGVLSPTVTVVSSTQISAVTPAGTVGSVLTMVINPNGQSVSVPGFSYSAGSSTNNGSLWVAGINPSSGTTGQLVSMTGGGFDSNTTVLFGGIPASSSAWIGAGYMMTYAPAGGSGTVNVTVTNSSGQTATAPTQFTFTGTTGGTSTGALSITSLEPSSVSAGNLLTISGTGFIGGATVSIGGYPATNVNVVTSGLITLTVPAGPSGSVVVVVTNPGGAVATFAGLSYGGTTTTGTVGQPSVGSVSPSTGSSAGGTSVTISGSGFVAPAAVTFGGVPATFVNVVNGNLITATTPANVVGAVSVLVSGPSGSVGGLTSGYTYELAWPRVTSLSPSTGALTGGTTLTINGTGFAPGATVTIGGQSVATVSAISPTQIVVSTPPAGAGPATILVTNNGGAISGLAGAFSYSANPQPHAPSPSAVSITGVTPATGPSAGGTAITISGTGFQSGAAVSISGINVAATVISSTQISATTPPVTGTGSVTVTVTNPGSAAVALPSAFTYGTGGTTGGTTTGGTTSPVPVGGGLFVFGGGTSAQLLIASGCNASTAVFWTTNAAGAWIGYIPSVPVAILNAEWTALFPNGIPAGTPIFARC